MVRVGMAFIHPRSVRFSGYGGSVERVVGAERGVCYNIGDGIGEACPPTSEGAR